MANKQPVANSGAKDVQTKITTVSQTDSAFSYKRDRA